MEKKYIVTKSQLKRLVRKAQTPEQELQKVLAILPKVELLCNKIASLREGAMAEHYLKQIKSYIASIKKQVSESEPAGQILSYASGMRMAALNLHSKSELSDKAYPLGYDLYYLISKVI